MTFQGFWINIGIERRKKSPFYRTFLAFVGFSGMSEEGDGGASRD